MKIQDVTAPWRRSTFCGTAACVEVADLADGTAVRDSKDPAGEPIPFTAIGWRAFIAEVRRGGFTVG
jgi:hypothetical protein